MGQVTAPRAGASCSRVISLAPCLCHLMLLMSLIEAGGDTHDSDLKTFRVKKGCNKGTLRIVYYLPCLPACCVFSDIRVFSHREGSSQGSIQSSLSRCKLGIAVAFDIVKSCVLIDYGILTSKLIKICVNCKLWYQQVLVHKCNQALSENCLGLTIVCPSSDPNLTLP